MKRIEIEQNIDKQWSKFIIALWGWASHETEYWKKRPSATAPFYSENVIKKAILNMIFTGRTDSEDMTLDEWVKWGQEFLNSLEVKKVASQKPI